MNYNYDLLTYEMSYSFQDIQAFKIIQDYFRYSLS